MVGMVGNYSVISELGQGAFGKVYKVCNGETHEQVIFFIIMTIDASVY